MKNKNIYSILILFIALNGYTQDSTSVKFELTFNKLFFFKEKLKIPENQDITKSNTEENSLSFKITFPSKRKTSFSFGITSLSYSREFNYIETESGYFIDSTLMSSPSKLISQSKSIGNELNIDLSINYLLYAYKNKQIFNVYTSLSLLMPFYSISMGESDKKYYHNNEALFYDEIIDRSQTQGYSIPIPNSISIGLSVNYFPVKHWGIMLSTNFKADIITFGYRVKDDFCFGICYR